MANEQIDRGVLEEQQIVLSDDSTQHTGYDCEFVERPQEIDAYCPICLLVLCEPHQVACCGKSYCRLCIKRVELQKKPCPTCNEQKLSFFADKRLKQVLYAFRVYCSHKKEGCQWTGELGELDKHLNVSPKLHEQLIGCEFTEVECHHCCDLFQRRYVTTHQIEECIRRPFSCDYCGNYGADYEDVTTKHWSMCGFYPVPCPNECGVCPERQNLEYHTHNDCPLTVVDCDYCCVGCKVQISRKDMSIHLTNDMAKHISLVATHSQREIQQKDKQIAKLKKEAQRKSQELRAEFTLALQQQLQETQDSILQETEEMTRQLRETEGRMTRQLREAEERMTRQLREAEDRIIARQLAANRESRKYNFGITAVGLLVVVAAIIAGGGYISYQETEILKNRTGNLIHESEVASRKAMEKVKQEINRIEVTAKTASVNMEQEIDLVKKQQKQIASKLEDAILRQVQVSTILAEHSTPVPPFEIFMPEFLKHKGAGDVWYSKPFYTHLHGYKLCLAVYANGLGSVENKQVSVFIHLMQGEYDNELVWPFQGNISVYLLNQFEDKGHHKMLVNFTKNGNKVIERDRALSGVGEWSFISHRQLSYKYSRTMHTQYLKHDSLRFRVADMEVGVDTVAVVPTDIIMTDFEGRKKKSEWWFSEPFYTHPGGYKMCLRVYANGYGWGRDTHVAVGVFLMQSKYDDQLEWPFRGDITIQLVNQKRDKEHWEKTFSFTDSARVVGQEIQDDGPGYRYFIAHTELNTEDKEYLKNDCLKFQVRKVVVKSI